MAKGYLSFNLGLKDHLGEGLELGAVIDPQANFRLLKTA